MSNKDTHLQAGALPQSVLDALRFYANGEHFNIDSDHQDFDTVSGEPTNWLMSTRDDDCSMIEDGSIARYALTGESLGLEESPKPVDGEVFATTATDGVARAETALQKINVIRNSIISLQTINWSERIYPLVAALDAAGIEGKPYPADREYLGSILEQLKAAEAELAELKATPAPSNLVDAAADDAKNRVTLDRRGLFDGVRGKIHDALNEGVPPNSVGSWSWEEATNRTLKFFNEYVDAAPATAARAGAMTVEAAREMGKVGAPDSESERALFEAYMRGHCWHVEEWSTTRKCYGDIQTRMLWAVWRDRAALRGAPTPVADSGAKPKYDPYDPGNWRDGDDACGNARAAKPASVDAVPVAQIVERCAQIADKYSCGTCGMDGKSAAEIRSILGDTTQSVIVQHSVAPPASTSADAQNEPRLDKPAQVGNTRFGMNVKWSTVIGAAQRYHEYMNTPEKEANRIAKGSQLLTGLQNAANAQTPVAPAQPAVAPVAVDIAEFERLKKDHVQFANSIARFAGRVNDLEATIKLAPEAVYYPSEEWCEGYAEWRIHALRAATRTAAPAAPQDPV